MNTTLNSPTDYQQWSNLSIRHWPLHSINLMRRYIWLVLQNAILMKDNGSHRARLSRKNNSHLFRLLDIFCFFNYHQTNKGHTCYISQISLFINGNKSKCGWADFINNNFCLMNEKEVHHYDNDVTNNYSANLQYTNPYENKTLSAVIIKCKKDFTSGLDYISQLTKRLQSLALITLNANICRFNQIVGAGTLN